MKVKDLEGSPQELHDFFQNNGMNISDYIAVPMKKLWLIIPVVLGMISLAAIVIGQIVYPEFSKKCLLGAVVVCLACLVWMAIVVQVMYSNTTGTIIAGIGGLLILLVAAGILPVAEILPTVKSLKSG